MNPSFADLPEPPYYAVVFCSRRNDDDAEGYAAAAERMLELAARQPGYLGAESARDDSGFGITVSYWKTEADIAAWKAHSDHLLAQRAGAERWYEHYEVRVAKVERAYGKR